jgi:hypothetical protein
MISIIHYISACRRLKESDKTITMLGGPEECQEMIMAQNDMIRLEKEYYYQEMVNFGFGCLMFVFVCVIIYALHYKGMIA